jgi:galactonate dehydratase
MTWRKLMKIGRIETFFVAPRWLFVRVESDDGAVGWGEASLEGHAEAVEGAFAPLRDRFIGDDPFRIEHIWQLGYRGGFYRGGPVLMSALAGLEQALWDLKGRALDLPVWEMLGGRVRDRIRAYAWIGGDRPDEIAQAAIARRDQGFSAVKMNATAELDWIGTPRLFDEVIDRVRRPRKPRSMSASISTAGSTGRSPSSWQRLSSRSACCSSRNRFCPKIRRGCRSSPS